MIRRKKEEKSYTLDKIMWEMLKTRGKCVWDENRKKQKVDVDHFASGGCDALWRICGTDDERRV